MAVKNLLELRGMVRPGMRKTVALVCAEDPHSLEALIHAKDIVRGLLIGDPEKIRETLRTLDADPSEFEIVPAPADVNPGTYACQLINQGRADFLMKGKIMTNALLKGVLAKEAEMRTGNLICGCVAIELPNYHKLLFTTDGGIVMYPDLEQKCGIIRNCVGFLHKLGYEEPNVGVLCALETISPKMVETVEAAELARRNRDGEITGCHVEGPISYDVAMNAEIARIKGYPSDRCGNFDLLVAPNIACGNVLTKALICSAGGVSCGLVLGARVPIVFSSRGSSAEEKYNSLLLASIVTGGN